MHPQASCEEATPSPFPETPESVATGHTGQAQVRRPVGAEEQHLWWDERGGGGSREPQGRPQHRLTLPRRVNSGYQGTGKHRPVSLGCLPEIPGINRLSKDNPQLCAWAPPHQWEAQSVREREAKEAGLPGWDSGTGPPTRMRPTSSSSSEAAGGCLQSRPCGRPPQACPDSRDRPGALCVGRPLLPEPSLALGSCSLYWAEPMTWQNPGCLS